MSGGLTIRRATAADAQAIAELFIVSFRLLTFLPSLHTPDEDRDYIRDILLPSHQVTVAERDGRVVGFMSEKDGWISQFYMDASERRSGVGSALMADAQARRTVIDLWCFEENLPARAFYEKHGFVGVERTDGTGNAEGRPDIHFRWMRPVGA